MRGPAGSHLDEHVANNCPRRVVVVRRLATVSGGLSVPPCKRTDAEAAVEVDLARNGRGAREIPVEVHRGQLTASCGWSRAEGKGIQPACDARREAKYTHKPS